MDGKKYDATFERAERARCIADGSIVPTGDVLENPRWFREAVARLPCLLLDCAARRAVTTGRAWEPDDDFLASHTAHARVAA